MGICHSANIPPPQPTATKFTRAEFDEIVPCDTHLLPDTISYFQLSCTPLNTIARVREYVRQLDIVKKERSDLELALHILDTYKTRAGILGRLGVCHVESRKLCFAYVSDHLS